MRASRGHLSLYIRSSLLRSQKKARKPTLWKVLLPNGSLPVVAPAVLGLLDDDPADPAEVFDVFCCRCGPFEFAFDEMICQCFKACNLTCATVTFVSAKEN